MKIAFVDLIPWDYNVATVDERPLGGAQSAACYLARELARRGHQIYFLSHAARSERLWNVECIAWSTKVTDTLGHLQPDVIVALYSHDATLDLCEKLAGHVPFVLWIHHAQDDPVVQCLRDQASYREVDAFVFVSDWQAQQFREAFAIPPEKAFTLRNAVGPAFEKCLQKGVLIREQKNAAPLLAFTSTPFRGLQVLLSLFPAIREQVPGVRLQVYSSMQVYQMARPEDELQFGRLYGYARRMVGVEYFGSIPQPALAQAMRQVSMLAYPNTFAETSCISVMEAMAAGCQIVTSDLGALPETTAGFATLVPLKRKTYIKDFVGVAVDRLQQRDTDASEERLRRQVAWVNREYTWANRAGEWEALCTAWWIQVVAPVYSHDGAVN